MSDRALPPASAAVAVAVIVVVVVAVEAPGVTRSCFCGTAASAVIQRLRRCSMPWLLPLFPLASLASWRFDGCCRCCGCCRFDGLRTTNNGQPFPPNTADSAVRRTAGDARWPA